MSFYHKFTTSTSYPLGSTVQKEPKKEEECGACQQPLAHFPSQRRRGQAVHREPWRAEPALPAGPVPGRQGLSLLTKCPGYRDHGLTRGLSCAWLGAHRASQARRLPLTLLTLILYKDWTFNIQTHCIWIIVVLKSLCHIFCVRLTLLFSARFSMQFKFWSFTWCRVSQLFCINKYL